MSTKNNLKKKRQLWLCQRSKPHSAYNSSGAPYCPLSKPRTLRRDFQDTLLEKDLPQFSSLTFRSSKLELCSSQTELFRSWNTYIFSFIFKLLYILFTFHSLFACSTCPSFEWRRSLPEQQRLGLGPVLSVPTTFQVNPYPSNSSFS